MPGLESPVKIATDRYGIPTIVAQSRLDATLALGYITARDRLGQIDILRWRATRANLSGTIRKRLSKILPRIPFTPDFETFAKAASALAELHLGYETCEQYPLQLVFTHKGEPQLHHFRLTEKAMRFVDEERTTLRINDHVSLSGIPEEAHRYVVNGRTPLEWYIDRYRIKTDKESGIVNDPNGWFEDPRDLVAAIKRIVHVSVESTRIIECLPSALTDSG